MGNEASLEGGELGPPSGLPEGLAPDGKGGFVRVSDGTPVNLGELSEEERRRLSAAVSRAQGRQPGAPARRQEKLINSDTAANACMNGWMRQAVGMCVVNVCSITWMERVHAHFQSFYKPP